MKNVDIKLANISVPNIKGAHKFLKNTLQYYMPSFPHRSLNMDYLFGLTTGKYLAFKQKDIIQAELK